MKNPLHQISAEPTSAPRFYLKCSIFILFFQVGNKIGSLYIRTILKRKTSNYFHLTYSTCELHRGRPEKRFERNPQCHKLTMLLHVPILLSMLFLCLCWVHLWHSAGLLSALIIYSPILFQLEWWLFIPPSRFSRWHWRGVGAVHWRGMFQQMSVKIAKNALA